MELKASNNFSLTIVFLLFIASFTSVLPGFFIKFEGELDVFQFIFVRVLFSLTILLPVFFWSEVKKNKVNNDLWWLHLIRAQLGYLAGLSSVYAIQNLPIATATAVFYSSPIFVVLISLFLLKVRVGKSVIISVFIGFCGVLIIVKPNDLEYSMFSALVSAVSVAGSNLIIKKIPNDCSYLQSLTYYYLWALPPSLVLLYFSGFEINAEHFGLAVIVSLLTLLFSLVNLYLYKVCEPSRIASFEYLGLVWSAILGFLYFGENVDWMFSIGCFFIFVPLIVISKVKGF
ncbi:MULTISPECIES: DMT family transporter [unclassified Pseudoalteromonas]|uniref:DMT family transporter n=1 Tax=unclassified Pseudoalteromonas TaxID=194690 RepID=UPI0013EE8471|nr:MULTISPECIES: DMT family transporter [unclassified Pseudoalteromonas]MCG7540026.1 DMT family transporter [Pseudoalteromonas sp. OF7H-1]